jgi:hypothetical protein
MQACATRYPLNYVTTPKLQLVSCTAVGRTPTKFKPLTNLDLCGLELRLPISCVISFTK